FSWLFGQGFFFFTVVIFSYIFIKDFEYAALFLIAMLILFLIVFGFGSYLILRQIKNKKSYYNKIVLLKQTQQVAYYEHNRKQAPVFHLINYKDIVASVRRNNGVVYEALNLHVIDPKTNQTIQSINLEDMQL
ncbi:hypothetical protein ACTXNA_13410, partial [Psychrobacter celer]